MAQPVSVPTSTRQLITVESATQSTNLRAVKLSSVRVQSVDRRYFIGDTDARINLGTDEAPLRRLWREKHGDVELEDLLNRRCCQEPMGSNIGALFYATAVFFLWWRPRNMLLILLRFLTRNQRLRFSTFDKVSSNQLVRSRPQERLR